MIPDIIRNTLFIGCGSFTTFSTFSKEGLMMLQAGNFMSLMAYVAISVMPVSHLSQPDIILSVYD